MKRPLLFWSTIPRSLPTRFVRPLIAGRCHLHKLSTCCQRCDMLGVPVSISLTQLFLHMHTYANARSFALRRGTGSSVLHEVNINLPSFANLSAAEFVVLVSRKPNA